jgi:ferrochelatase
MPPVPARLGVILFNLGGPERLEDVQPFLENIFSDPDIIPLPVPAVMRRWLARRIAAARAKHSRANYAQIGGGSPLVKITRAQASALENLLRQETGKEIFVRMGMRYWKPFVNETIEEFHGLGVHDVFLLPLYPHYSVTSSGSSFADWKKMHNNASKLFSPHAANGKVFRVRSVKDFYMHPKYIASLSQTIDEGIARFTPEERATLHLLFSAHGTPASVAERGDPYQHHIRATMNAVMQLRNFDYPFALSFQSRVGPMKWLKPYTTETLREFGAKGIKNLLVIPISFVGDHIETLFELNIEAREIAESARIRHYEVTPGLNDRPLFIATLANIVRSRYTA